MPLRVPLRRQLGYAFYDWTREMPAAKRATVCAGIFLQGYAIYAGFTRSLVWPVVWPRGIVLFPILLVIYQIGHWLRFATAVFIMLDRSSGQLVYVNAGHNPPMVFGPGSAIALDATCMALGWFAEATFEARTAAMAPADGLLVYTDGLTDAIAGENPESRLRDTLTAARADTMASIKSLIDPAFNEDDVTVLLVRRT